MNTTLRQRQIVLIVLVVVIITGLMYVAEGRWAAAPVLRYLYLIPIAQAAMSFGLTGSMTVAILADLLFAPLIAVALSRYGFFAAPTAEIMITLVLMPTIAYFAGSGWGRLSRQRELYQLLSGMGDLFGRSLPRDAVLEQILEQSGQLIDAGSGEILLLDDQQPYSAAHWGPSAATSADYTISLAHDVLASNRTWVASYLDQNPRYVRVADGPRIDSVLAVPLHLGGEPVGLLAFFNRPGGFGRDEQGAVKAIGSKVEVVLENFRHMRQQGERERLQREFELAAEVQARFLPHSVPHIDGYEVVGHTIPAREIGGDFFTFAELADGTWFIAVGDVSGKGIVGAFYMAIATNLIDAYLHDNIAADRSLLLALNRLFHPRMAAQNINTALCYVLLDPVTGKVRIGNAGLISPLYVRCDDGDCDYVDVVGLPLGAFDGAQYHEQELVLQPSESLVLVSDGVVEARDAQRTLFGLDALRDLVQTSGDGTEQLAHNVLEAANQFSGSHEPHDDMTVVVIRRMPAVPKQLHSQHLAAVAA